MVSRYNQRDSTEQWRAAEATREPSRESRRPVLERSEIGPKRKKAQFTTARLSGAELTTPEVHAHFSKTFLSAEIKRIAGAGREAQMLVSADRKRTHNANGNWKSVASPRVLAASLRRPMYANAQLSLCARALINDMESHNCMQMNRLARRRVRAERITTQRSLALRALRHADHL